ncbi:MULTISPECIES: NAD(P)/FAD-dependent oxidoreductase [unclassified Streptomyces]|uniref:NAD(P)/FAD-dependent oxidoreductase n=1 Tax=unclassified Streptomyces TaxID=2593676 RepID=UPI00166217EE|nr:MULTISPECIES: tryptophan 7-halogenase [unclassified Streptomyces]MBD0838242.1 tryptophan 7-halogenase [Streptomyces sp. TRM68416]
MTRTPNEKQLYDVAILGSGFAGSMLGAILARNGAKVLLLDAKSHPKFAIGESTIPNMLVTLRTMALRYDVPELMAVSTFTGCQKVISASHGQKIHFGFLTHQEGKPQDPRQLTMFNFPKLLLHPAAHMLRQDTDAYLYHVAVGYGCETRTGFFADDVDFDGSGVTLSSSATGEQFRARYVVDASGYQSPLAKKFGLREDPCRFRHHSRSMWNHMLDTPKTDDVFRRPREDSPPVPWYDGTVHHLIDRGWFWLIAFDNHRSSRNPLCSVGLTLDPRKYPRPADRSVEEDFWYHVNRYPDIARQFEGIKPMREWVATDRLQYSSSRTVGDRWVLLAHAAAFIDPLFSRGLHNTCEAVNVLAWRILRAVGDDDFSADRFAGVDRRQQALFDGNDKLVNAAYQSFSHHELWSAVFRIWAWGSNAGTFRALEAFRRWRKDGKESHLLELESVENPGLHWSDHEGYSELFNAMVDRCDDYAEGRISGPDAADELYERIQESAFVPRHWGWTERELRFINPTMGRITKTMWWAATQAPDDVRRLMLGFLRESSRELVRGRRIL